MTPHDAAFSLMVDTAHLSSQTTDPVTRADLRTSLSDLRIALALANGVPIWLLDRNGNGRAAA